MTNQVIPAEAVEAAADAMAPVVKKLEALILARAALEAAAPYMLAAVSSIEELNALPDDSVVMSETTAYQKYGYDSWAGDGRFFGNSQIKLPAVVLHAPHMLNTEGEK